MAIRNLNNNYTFYEGYEDENEIVLYIETDEAIHIWEGYFGDIFDTIGTAIMLIIVCQFRLSGVLTAILSDAKIFY